MSVATVQTTQKKRADSSHVSHYLFVRALSAVRDDVTSANLVQHFEVRVFLRCVGYF